MRELAYSSNEVVKRQRLCHRENIHQMNVKAELTATHKALLYIGLGDKPVRQVVILTDSLTAIQGTKGDNKGRLNARYHTGADVISAQNNLTMATCTLPGTWDWE